MTMPHRFRMLFVLALLILATACATRSISDSGYPGDRASGNRYYRGELSELDVLGVSAEGEVTEEAIRQAAVNKPVVKVPRGGALVVIQSGAIAPDSVMLDELSKNFRVVPFSGIPDKEADRTYSRRLRLTAARGGYTHILCYWGTLETAQEDKATKAISWIPIAGSFVPDESQKMRIRLRGALIDVASGQWTMIAPDPVEDSALSSSLTRSKSDQKQVELLKQKGYSTLASELVRYFSS
jgi:hypothetical protein